MKTSAVASDAVMACSSMIVGIIGALPREQRVHDVPQLVGRMRARDQRAIAPAQRLDRGRHIQTNKRRLYAQAQAVHDGDGVRSGHYLSARWSGLRRTRVPMSAWRPPADSPAWNRRVDDSGIPRTV
jgi:hypothetical protein